MHVSHKYGLASGHIVVCWMLICKIVSWIEASNLATYVSEQWSSTVSGKTWTASFYTHHHILSHMYDTQYTMADERSKEQYMLALLPCVSCTVIAGVMRTLARHREESYSRRRSRTQARLSTTAHFDSCSLEGDSCDDSGYLSQERIVCVQPSSPPPPLTAVDSHRLSSDSLPRKRLSASSDSPPSILSVTNSPPSYRSAATTDIHKIPLKKRLLLYNGIFFYKFMFKKFLCFSIEMAGFLLRTARTSTQRYSYQRWTQVPRPFHHDNLLPTKITSATFAVFFGCWPHWRTKKKTAWLFPVLLIFSPPKGCQKVTKRSPS